MKYTVEAIGVTVQYPGALDLGHVEAWVSGKCVLIPIETFVEMLETLKAQKALRNTRYLQQLKKYVIF